MARVVEPSSWPTPLRLSSGTPDFSTETRVETSRDQLPGAFRPRVQSFRPKDPRLHTFRRLTRRTPVSYLVYSVRDSSGVLVPFLSVHRLFLVYHCRGPVSTAVAPTPLPRPRLHCRTPVSRRLSLHRVSSVWSVGSGPQPLPRGLSRTFSTVVLGRVRSTEFSGEKRGT